MYYTSYLNWKAAALVLKHVAGWSYRTETVEEKKIIKIIRFLLFVFKRLKLNRTGFLRVSNRLWWWIETTELNKLWFYHGLQSLTKTTAVLISQQQSLYS